MKVKKFNESSNEGEYFILSNPNGIGYGSKVQKIGEENGKIKFKHLSGNAIGYAKKTDLISIDDFSKKDEYIAELRKLEKQHSDYIEMLREKGFKIEEKNGETHLYPIDIRGFK